MESEENFLEELLAEAEAKEEQQTEAYFDLVLLNIRQLQEKIAHSFEEAEKEIALINDWTLRKNHGLQTKVEWLEKRLEAFIIERGVKTLELPNGVLKYHKKQDKVEITDMDLFLKNAPAEVLSVQPELVKPDLTKLKNYLKTHFKPIPGTVVISGKQEFTYTLNNRKEADDDRKKTTRDSAQSADEYRAAV